MRAADLLERVAALRTWVRGGERAPNKPLLILVALGRIQRGESRLMALGDVENVMRKLLTDYGPERAQVHPEYPFWRLTTDGFWQVDSPIALPARKGNTNPPLAALRDPNVK